MVPLGRGDVHFISGFATCCSVGLETLNADVSLVYQRPHSEEDLMRRVCKGCSGGLGRGVRQAVR